MRTVMMYALHDGPPHLERRGRLARGRVARHDPTLLTDKCHLPPCERLCCLMATF